MDHYELLILDMDGVLVDTSRCHRRAYKELWSRIGIQGPCYDAIAGRVTSEVITALTADLKPSDVQISEWIRFKQEQARKYLGAGMIAYNDTFLSLAALARSKVRLAVGTGASRETTDLVLRRLQIVDFFSIILTGGEVQNGKPSPEIYLRIMMNAGASPTKTLIIEDSLSGIEAAVASGAYVASVRTGMEIRHPKFVGAFTDLRELVFTLGIQA